MHPACTLACMWRSKDQLQEQLEVAASPLPPHGSQGSNSDNALGGSHLHPLSQLTGLSTYILKSEEKSKSVNSQC